MVWKLALCIEDIDGLVLGYNKPWISTLTQEEINAFTLRSDKIPCMLYLCKRSSLCLFRRFPWWVSVYPPNKRCPLISYDAIYHLKKEVC